MPVPVTTTTEYVVKISGVDECNKPFRETTSIVQSTPHRIRVSRVPGQCTPGSLVAIEHRGERDLYRVVAVEPGAGAELVPADSNLANSSAAPSEAEGAVVERRRHPRRLCVEMVRITEAESGAAVEARLSDVSAGGCYIQTIAPLAVGKIVLVEASSPELKLRVSGRVVTSHPLIGMGVEFCEPAEFGSDAQPTAELPSSSRPAPPPLCTEPLLTSLLQWFGDNQELNRAQFFRLLHESSRAAEYLEKA